MTLETSAQGAFFDQRKDAVAKAMLILEPLSARLKSCPCYKATCAEFPSRVFTRTSYLSFKSAGTRTAPYLRLTMVPALYFAIRPEFTDIVNFRDLGRVLLELSSESIGAFHRM